MKTIFNLAAVAATFAGVFSFTGSVAAQQETPKYGFIRIVNAVDRGDGYAKFAVDGGDIYPKGYKLGQTSGGLSLKQGSHSITVSKTGLEAGTTKMNLAANETITLIAFAEEIPAEKKEDPPIWTIKLLRLKQRDVEKGYALTLVSVAKEPETAVQLAIQGTGSIEKTSVKRLNLTNIGIGDSRGEVFVKVADKIITTVSPDSPGNYVVVLYNNPAGETVAINFFDPKFVIAG